MPGLFGIIPSLQCTHVNKAQIQSDFDRMERALSHEDSELFTSQKNSLAQSFIGKIGIPSLFKSFNFEEWELQGFGLFDNIPSFSKNWINQVSGSFSLLAHNRITNDFYLVSDRTGSQPIYYFWKNSCLYFSPEVKSLRSIPNAPNGVNFSALGSLLASGHLLSGQTLYADIHSLTGGTLLQIKGESYETKRYWRFSPGINSETQPPNLEDILYSLINKSVNKSLSNGPAIFLSGGVDSRAILGAYLENRKKANQAVSTVSWGIDENAFNSDAEIARKMSTYSSTNHIFLKRSVDNFSEYFTKTISLIDWHSDVPAYHSSELSLMQQLSHQGIKTVVRGDETFGWKKLSRSIYSCLSLVGLKPIKFISGLNSLLNNDVLKIIKDQQEPSFSDLIQSKPPEFSQSQFKDYLYFYQRLQTYLNTASYYKMYYFFHYNPLLDYNILDFIEYLPDSHRKNKQFFRNYVMKYYPDLNKFEYAKHSGLEPVNELVYSDTSVRKYISEHIDDKTSDVWNIFRREEIKNTFNSKFNYQNKSNFLEAFAINTMRMFGRFTSSDIKCHYDSLRELSQPIPNSKVLLRFLIIKDWIDKSKPSIKI